MEYNHIVNPISGKKVNLFGNQGKKIINNYLNILQHGGNECNGLRKAPCIEHKECEWGMPTGKKPNRCHVPKSDEPSAVNPATAPVLVKPTKKTIISKKTKPTAVQPSREEKTTPVKDKIHKYYFTGKIELVRLVDDPTIPNPSNKEIYNYMVSLARNQDL